VIGKNKTQFWVIVDKRIDNLLRKEAMKKGLSKCAYVRHILNKEMTEQGHNINDLLNQVP